MESVDFVRFFVALIFVLGLIGLMGVLLKRFGPIGVGVKPGNKARLSIQEILPLDPRNRLMLVRLDDAEHLIVLGQQGVNVVESNIRITREETVKEITKPQPRSRKQHAA